MKKSNKIIIWIVLIIFVPRIVVSCSLWGNKTYSGRLIDADTLEPIEGAVVVAVWNKRWPGIGAGGDTKFKMAREVLTDANGEWSIRGPKGSSPHEQSPVLTIVSGIFYLHITTPCRLIYYKPGYCRYVQKPGDFAAIPYIDKEKGLEGIVLYRMGNTDEDIREFLDEYEFEMPLVPVKDPVTVLKSNKFSYQYTDDFIRIPKRDMDIQFRVIGLKQAETKEERRRAKITPSEIDDWADLPILKTISDEERQKLYIEGRK